MMTNNVITLYIKALQRFPVLKPFLLETQDNPSAIESKDMLECAYCSRVMEL